MATVYKIKLVSHWISYSEEEIKEILLDAININENKNA